MASQGQWKVGETLPTELQLSSDFNVSRSTVRQALKQLEDWGMVSRVPKRGTTLTASEPRRMFNRQSGALEQLDVFAQTTCFHVETTSECHGPDLVTEHAAGFAIRDRWIACKGWRSWVDDNSPTSWTQFSFDGLYEGAKHLIGGTQQPGFRIIENAYNLRIVSIDQIVRAILAPDDVCSNLGWASGSPALEVKRLMTDSDGQAVVHAHSIHIWSAVSIQMKINP